MSAVFNEKRCPTSMAVSHQADGTQISRGFKVHNLITYESKVQVVVPKEVSENYSPLGVSKF